MQKPSRTELRERGLEDNNDEDEDGDRQDVSIWGALPRVIVGKRGGRRMQTEVGLPLPSSATVASASQPCYANLATTSKKKKPAASPPSAGAVQRDYENFR